MARTTAPRGVALHNLASRAEWVAVAEDKYTRLVADYRGYMLEVWGYPDGVDAGSYYWRVSHRTLVTSLVGFEANERRARGAAVKRVLELTGGTPVV